MVSLQDMPTGQLLNEYRDILLALGNNRGDTALSRKSDMYEEEISRRMAW